MFRLYHNVPYPAGYAEGELLGNEPGRGMSSSSTAKDVTDGFPFSGGDSTWVGPDSPSRPVNNLSYFGSNADRTVDFLKMALYGTW